MWRNSHAAETPTGSPLLIAITTLAPRLEGLLGSANVVSTPEELRRYAVDGVVPSAIAKPNSAAEVAEIVRFAIAERLCVIPTGGRTKLGIGRPPDRYDIAIDMTGLRQLAHYDPGDLTLSADAGMTVHALQEAVAANGQFLPLALPFFSETTVGGSVASGIDSVYRRLLGSARDFLIGAEFVDGKGASCKSGGRVVKNVTGYDLHKLFIGSLGTLAVITRLNFRTYTWPETSASQVASFSSLENALAFRAELERSGLPFFNLEVLSPGLAAAFAKNLRAKTSSAPSAFENGGWVVYAGWAGNPSVVRRIETDLELCTQKCAPTQAERLDGTLNSDVHVLFREAFPLLCASSPDTVVLRIVHPRLPAEVLGSLSEIASKENLAGHLLMRPVGVSYFALVAGTGELTANGRLARAANAAVSLFAKSGATYSILQASTPVKASVPLWGPRGTDFALMRSVKRAFDPGNTFAPGRLAEGL
jgi:glycolate oxidase FAD binding subunit